MKVSVSDASEAPGAPGSGGKRRGSRRSKVAWRKHVDIADVENFLEQQRLEERDGVTLKTDAELFVVDTAGDDQLQDAARLTQRQVVTTKRQKRSLLSSATPRCYSNLENTSRLPDPGAPRNTVRPPGAAPADLNHRTARRKADRPTHTPTGTRVSTRTRRQQHVDADAWGQDSESTPRLDAPWLDAEAVSHNVCPGVTRPAPRPASRPLRRVPPPVPPPHPGQSYNPTYEDHQALLNEIAEKEKLLIKKEKHLERVTTALYKRVKPDLAQSEWVKEMMSGLPEVTPAPAPTSDSESDGEVRSVNPPVRNRKKDAATRRRRAQHKLMQQTAKQRRVDKKKLADISRLRFLEASLARAEAGLRLARERRAARAAARAPAPPALNAHKLPPTDEPFLAPAELRRALREQLPAGNLLRERWESLQARGAVAPSKIYLRKKLRLKTYWKPGHKVTPAHVAAFLDKANQNKQTKRKLQ